MPLLMMDDQRHCKIADDTGAKMPCTCTESKSDTILKIMLMTGNGFMQNSAQANLFYMLFNDKEDCTCTFDHDKTQTGTCSNERDGDSRVCSTLSRFESIHSFTNNGS